MSSGLKRLNDSSSGSAVTSGADFTGRITLQFGAALSPSAGVLTLGSDGNSFHIGGTVQNITSITNITGSGPFFCIMDSAHTLVHATGTIETNTGVDIICTVGDRFRFDQDSDGTTWLVTQEGKGISSGGGGGGAGNVSVYHATGDGAKTIFSSVDFSPANFYYTLASNSLMVFIDAVYQQTSAYSETNSSTITFSAPIPNGSIVEIRAGSIPVNTGNTRTGYSGIGDGVKVAFTVADFSPSSFVYPLGVDSIDVYVGNVFQDPSAYSETNTNTITFVTAPPSGASVYINVQSALPMVDALPATSSRRLRPNWKLISSNTQAISGDGLFVDTVAAPVTVTLPLAGVSSIGDYVVIDDSKSNFATNNCNVASDTLIMGAVSPMAISTNNTSVELVFNGSDWRII